MANIDLKSMHWVHLDQNYTAFRRELATRSGDWRYGPIRVHEVAQEAYLALSAHGPIQGRNYCELGCGVYHPFGISTVMFLNGSGATLATDLMAADRRRAAEALADLLTEILALPEEWHWSAIARDEFLARARLFNLKALRTGRLEEGLANIPMAYCITDIHQPDLAPDSIEWMSSRATLEHFLDFPAALRRMRQLMRSGAIAAHHIDLVDHRAYESSQFHFWSFLSEAEGWTDGLCNRLRACEIRSAIEKAGFRVLKFDTLRGNPPADLRSRLAPRYRAMPDDEIAITTVNCVLQNP